MKIYELNNFDTRIILEDNTFDCISVIGHHSVVSIINKIPYIFGKFVQEEFKRPVIDLLKNNYTTNKMTVFHINRPEQLIADGRTINIISEYDVTVSVQVVDTNSMSIPSKKVFKLSIVTKIKKNVYEDFIYFKIPSINDLIYQYEHRTDITGDDNYHLIERKIDNYLNSPNGQIIVRDNSIVTSASTNYKIN